LSPPAREGRREEAKARSTRFLSVVCGGA